jgi:hypothetical protein
VEEIEQKVLISKPRSKVTLMDVVDALTTMSETVENYRTSTETLHKTHQEQDAESFGRLENRMSKIENRQLEISDALGVSSKLPSENKKEKKHKPIMMMSQTEGIIKLGTTFLIITGIWKFVGFAWPFAWTFLKALNVYIIGH